MNDNKLPSLKEISVVKSKINQQFNKQNTQTCCALCGNELKNSAKSFHKSHTVLFLP